MICPENLRHLGIPGQVNEGVPIQIRHRETAELCRRVLRRKGGFHQLIHHGNDLQVIGDRQHKEAAVHLPASCHLLGGDGLIAGDETDPDVRVIPVETLQDLGDPVEGDAVEDQNPDFAGVQVLQVIHPILQEALRGSQLPELGKQGPALGGELHAAVLPDEERKAQLLLHGADDVADAGLGVAQLVGGFAEVQSFCRLQKYGGIDFIHTAVLFKKNFKRL